MSEKLDPANAEKLDPPKGESVLEAYLAATAPKKLSQKERMSWRQYQKRLAAWRAAHKRARRRKAAAAKQVQRIRDDVAPYKPARRRPRQRREGAKRIMAALQGRWVTSSEVREETGLSRGMMNRMLAWLMEKGDIARRPNPGFIGHCKGYGAPTCQWQYRAKRTGVTLKDYPRMPRSRRKGLPVSDREGDKAEKG